jgi:hypothetical protein
MVERVGFEQLFSFSNTAAPLDKDSSPFLESWLRSWVQIPPGPFLSVVQLRYYFEFNLDNCRTKKLDNANAVSSSLSYIAEIFTRSVPIL